MTSDLRQLRADLDRIRETAPPRSELARVAFERLFRASIEAGQPLDSLRTRTANEVERFFAHTIPGVDGHVYWTSSSAFVRNDRKQRAPRRWWWAHVHEGVELGPYEDLVAVCGEKNCINPDHCQVGRGLRRYRFTPDQMLGALKVVALRLGRAPKAKEWDALGGSPTHSIFAQRFGSWHDALRAAGLTPSAHRQPAASAADCIASITHVRGLVGHWPTFTDFDRSRASLREAGLPSSATTIRRMFGSWQAAVAKSASVTASTTDGDPVATGKESLA